MNIFNLARKPKITVNLLAHDGITSLYTGVGRVAHDSLKLLCEDKKISKLVDCVNAITGKYDEKCLGYSKTIKERSVRLLNGKRGKLIEVLNGSGGEVSYGDISNWRDASLSSANLINNLSKLNPKNLYINLCLDTPFAHVASYFQQYDEEDKANHIFVWIPHSTVKIHKIDSAIKGYDEYFDQRAKWEREAVDLANNNKNVFVGFTGKFMREHLIKDYSCKPEKMLDYTNGVNIDDPRFSLKLSENEIEEILDQYRIPKDQDLMLSFGRLEPYKGFDLTIKIGGQLDPEKIVTVLMAQPYSQEDQIINEYKELMKKYNPKGIFISSYNFKLPHVLLRWYRTKILMIPSLAEPFGLIPEETRLYNNPNLCIVAMNKDGFVEQITNGKDGFLIDLTKIETSSEQIKKILTIPYEESKKMAKNGFIRVMSDYSLADNLYRSINETIKKCQNPL